MYSILITGASSGIGKELAKIYAGTGKRLLLIGRNHERLQEVFDYCRYQGAIVEMAVLDVCDQDNLARQILAWDQEYPIDLVIANAGISQQSTFLSSEKLENLFAVNVQGVFNTILPLIEPMKQRRSGQIALMSSIAAFRGYAGKGGYAATKAAVKAYGEALRSELKPYGVQVSVICPGFVITPLTSNNKFTMPFKISAEKAACAISKGLEKDSPRIGFPFITYWLAYGAGILPARLSDWLSDFLVKKMIKPRDQSE